MNKRLRTKTETTPFGRTAVRILLMMLVSLSILVIVNAARAQQQ